MPTVTVWIDIGAPVDRVWEAASDLARHGEWMRDVESIVFDSPQTHGLGTQLRVATKLGPLHSVDLMAVTAWEPKRLIGVEHRGLVSGSGEFRLDPVGGATRFTWRESLRFPWQFGGPIGAWLARPIFVWIWRHNLQELKRRLEL